MVTHLHYSCTQGMVDFIIWQMGVVCSPSSLAGAAQWLLFRGPRPLPLPLVFVPSQPPEEVRGWPGKVGGVAMQQEPQHPANNKPVPVSNNSTYAPESAGQGLLRALQSQEGLRLVWGGAAFSILSNIPQRHGKAVESSWVFLSSRSPICSKPKISSLNYESV